MQQNGLWFFGERDLDLQPLHILSVGHACWDLVATVPAFPVEDEKQEIAELQESGGGPAANAACVAARWGLRVAFAGTVGDDHHGQAAVAELVAYGVDCRLTERRSGHATPVSLVLVNAANGSRTIINRKRPTAALQLDVARLRAELGTPKVLLFDGHERLAAEAALGAFPQSESILDAGSVREGTVALADRVTHLAASARFARQVTGIDPRPSVDAAEDALWALRQRFLSPRSVTITLGAAGAVSTWAGGRRQHFAAPLVVAVETTAAGDIWHGALAYALAQAWPLDAAVRLAIIAASESVTRPGGRCSMPPKAPDFRCGKQPADP